MYQFRPSGSGLFELFAEVLVEGDCVNPGRVHWNFVGAYDTFEAFNKAAELVGYCQARYPESFCRVHNELARRQEQRRREEWATDAPF